MPFVRPSAPPAPSSRPAPPPAAPVPTPTPATETSSTGEEAFAAKGMVVQAKELERGGDVAGALRLYQAAARLLPGHQKLATKVQALQKAVLSAHAARDERMDCMDVARAEADGEGAADLLHSAITSSARKAARPLSVFSPAPRHRLYHDDDTSFGGYPAGLCDVLRLLWDDHTCGVECVFRPGQQLPG
jgi:hypothetical protein